MNYLKYSLFLILLAFWLGCPMKQPDYASLPDDVQTISLLGDTLRTPGTELPPDLDQRIDSLITEAETDTVTVKIWEARRLGYQGEYRKAIEKLEEIEGPMEQSELARFFRHRGHRYITLRAFEHAAADLMHASDIVKEIPDIVETDGLPNNRNIPLSSLHTNIWYHQGLAFYLLGEYERAERAYSYGIEASSNDDMLVAMFYWYYMSLKRQGHDMEAGKILNRINPEMDIIENDSYLKLLLVFKGEFDSDMLINEEADQLTNSTIGYGLGNWHFMNGRKERAQQIWQQVYDSGNWAAFGFIASEAELARLE